MRCNKVKKILGAYLDGELSERKAKRVQKHMAKCSACAWELKSFQKIDELGRWITEASSPQLPKSHWEDYLTNLHERIEQAEIHRQSSLAGFFSQYWHFPLTFASYWFKKIAPGLAAALVIIGLGVGINYLRHDFDTPSATQSKRSLQITASDDSESEKITINFYLKEHENALMQVAHSTQPSRGQIKLDRKDLFHYNAVRGPKGELPAETGIFLRAPRRSSYPTNRKPSQAFDIANGHKLSLQKAQETVSFKIVAPQTFYPGYFLETIRKIEGRECLQLIYTNGVSTVSLFEQAVESKERFHSGDFSEYVMYSKGDGDEPVNIIGWNSTGVSFTLIGEEDFSHLMSIIRAVQKNY